MYALHFLSNYITRILYSWLMLGKKNPLLDTEHKDWNCWTFKNAPYFPNYWNSANAKISLSITFKLMTMLKNVVLLKCYQPCYTILNPLLRYLRDHFKNKPMYISWNANSNIFWVKEEPSCHLGKMLPWDRASFTFCISC